MKRQEGWEDTRGEVLSPDHSGTYRLLKMLRRAMDYLEVPPHPHECVTPRCSDEVRVCCWAEI